LNIAIYNLALIWHPYMKVRKENSTFYGTFNF